jgi:glutaredoxin
MSEFQLLLVTNNDCQLCEPYSKLLDAWGIDYDEVNMSLPENKLYSNLFALNRLNVQGAPNIVILKDGKPSGMVEGFIKDRVSLKLKLEKHGFRMHII